MRKALAMLFFLALPGQSELQYPQILPALPPWADPAPREVLSNPILDSIDNVVLNTWTLEPAPFSDWVLAAILSRTPIRS
jgi:hypothetical protein